MTEHNSNKKIRLEKPVPEETIKAISRDTLKVGGLAGPAPPSTPNIGDKMPDGTIYAGIAPFTNEPLYTMPQDAPLSMKFNQAIEHAAKLNAYGHQDWRVPTASELDLLFNNRAAIGGFGEASGRSDCDGWYWSSRQSEIAYTNLQLAASRQFNTGSRGLKYQHMRVSLRCVR